MKVKYIGKQNKYFINGMVYDAKTKGGSCLTKISIKGKLIAEIINPIFNSDFVEHKEPKRARYTGVDGSWFTYGKVYKFVKEKDLNGNKYMSVSINSMSALPVDMEFFKNNFSVLSDDGVEAKKQYMVFAQNNQAPKKIHDSYELAETEAKRLAGLTGNIGKTIYVMEVKKMFKSKVVIDEC